MKDNESSSVRTQGKKATFNQYHLSVDKRKERVFRDFFMKTSDIGRKTIDYTINQKRSARKQTVCQQNQ